MTKSMIMSGPGGSRSGETRLGPVTPPLLELASVSKTYPGVKALDRVSLKVCLLYTSDAADE